MAGVSAEVHDYMPATRAGHGEEYGRFLRQPAVVTMPVPAPVLVVISVVEHAHIGLRVEVYADGLAARTLELLMEIVHWSV